MKKTIILWQIAGFIFTGVLGVLLHFLYDISNQNTVVAIFSAVNESIWEHLKLLFFPMFLFAIIQKWYMGKYFNNFWCVKLTGIALAIALVPILYYTINGIFGSMADWFNIAIFYIASACAYIVEAMLFLKNILPCKSPRTAVAVLFTFAFLFALFTFYPPSFPIFQPPVL